jgi:hypothetical protein
VLVYWQKRGLELKGEYIRVFSSGHLVVILRLWYHSSMANKKKKLDELKIPTDLVNNTPNTYQVADELEKQLNAFGKDVVNMMTYGTMPELVDLSWEVYEKFKRGELQDLAGSDAELKRFFEFKKKDLVIKLLGFLEIASNALLDPSKMKGSSLKEITHSLKITLDMLNALHGTSEPKKHEHTHTHKVAKNVEEIDARLAETRQQLDAIEAEFEETTDESNHI